MKFKINNKYFRWGLTAFIVIAASIVFYYFMFHHSNIKAGIGMLTDIVMPVILGLVMGYLLTPILNFLEDKIMIPLCNKCRIRESSKRNSIIRGIGILITACLFVSLIYMLISMLLSQIIPSIQNIVGNFNAYTDNFTKWLDKLLEDNPEVGEFVVQNVNKYMDELEKLMRDFTRITPLIRTVSLSVISVFGTLWDVIIGFIISIYVMASKEKFAGQAKKIVYAAFEPDTANTVIRNFRFTHKTFIGFISGKILDSIIIGILCFIGTSILRTPYAALVSVIIGVTNVIPFFGPYLGAIPCGILVFIVDPLHPLNCVYFLLFILILQQFDGNILGPKILGSSTGLTGFWVISSITLFGGLFGVLGMIIGVPIFAVIYAAIRSLVNTSLRKKELPCETKKYENLDYIDEDGLHENILEKRDPKHRQTDPEKPDNHQNSKEK
ncbi:MAG: AI-2E family transporter [Eubacterium sp.]|nr:AI-2E family transporter [Eubacterium sp.]MCM1304247.1 AI-2E family transporter [Butyrivibrio sp.]MCM1345008.1 AI-2E family transporter [Muribaculaceae bacterium]MCM1409684.1 AI-2E family transporter [Lachnospiraceae bacterium]